jgi:cytochrome o ubiquinol oxidase operon protein cyoD
MPSTLYRSAFFRSSISERTDVNEHLLPQGAGPGADARRHGNHRSYLVGFGAALILTLASFWAASTGLVYGPSVPLLLGVLAIAQMGVHVVFFFQISSAPDQTNNLLALAFGVLVVGLTVFGSMLIMGNLNHMTPTTETLLQMQR